jgi:hypothetical protein
MSLKEVPTIYCCITYREVACNSDSSPESLAEDIQISYRPLDFDTV